MDHLEKILGQWKVERPDLDCTPMGIWGRIQRMQSLASKSIESTLKEFGLTKSDFDVLATLRRKGTPLTPTELYQSALLSSGAMTAKLDKLQARELIARLPSGDDRRSLLVALTDSGLALIDRAVSAHVDNEWQMLHPLDTSEQEQLATLLAKWLIHNE